MADRYTADDLRKLGLVENPNKPGEFIKAIKSIDPYKHKSIVQQKNNSIFDTKALLNRIKYLEENLLISFKVDPMGKPRMTQQDKWNKREVTDRYWSYKHQLQTQAKGANFILPDSMIHMVFHIPMAQSWSKSKKEEYNRMPHKNKPDGDNILKGIQDALCKDDSFIWDIRITKFWAYKGRIDIYKI